MLGSLVTINNPKNTRAVTTLQARNVRITITHQKAEVMFELYDPKQPVEQFNANLAVPTRPIHDTRSIPDSELDAWTKDISYLSRSDSQSVVETSTAGPVHYCTGIPSSVIYSFGTPIVNTSNISKTTTLEPIHHYVFR